MKSTKICKQTILALHVTPNRCSDYDEECKDFTKEQAHYCWMGQPCWVGGKHQQWVYVGQADGYCPIAHGE